MILVKRLLSPTPKFFKVLRNIGLTLAAIGGTIMAAPIALPIVLSSVGGYMTLAGGIITAVSQLTSETDLNPNGNQ